MIWPGTLFFSLIKFSAWSGISGYTRKRPDYLTISYLGQNIFTENHRFPDQTCQNIFRKYSQEATVFLIRFGRCRIFLLAQIPKFRFLDVSFSTDKYLTNCTNQSVLAIRFQLLEKFTTTFVKQYSKILLVIMLILMNIRILMMLFF